MHLHTLWYTAPTVGSCSSQMTGYEGIVSGVVCLLKSKGRLTPVFVVCACRQTELLRFL